MAEESASAAATSAESLATGRASRLLISQLQTKPTASVISMMKENSCCSRWAKAKSCTAGTEPTRSQCLPEKGAFRLYRFKGETEAM